uniref:Uncharacterized protein n=1 Tax=Avena sativa TaxID=4498 RepID=A0ACD5VV84_AVESA
MTFLGGDGGSGGGSDGQNGSTRPHFVLVPMMGQGHTIPMTDMARLLAEHGAQVSFITTPVNAARLAGFAADVEAAGLAVRLVEIRFPAAEFGLPDGCENFDLIQSRGLLLNFLEACAALQGPLMAHLREQQLSPPSCIISSQMHWWTGDIARELNIPRLAFGGFCGFSSLVRYYNHKRQNSLAVNVAYFTCIIKYLLPSSYIHPFIFKKIENLF